MQLVTSIRGCVLRHWAPADKASLVVHANNHRVWRNLADIFPHPYTDADADQWLSLANSPTRSLNLAIEFEGVAVGGIGARAGEGIFVRTAQFGYWLGEPFWGRGIMTAAGNAMLDHLRQDGRFARLEAPVFEWNPSSMRVLEKIGFVREAVKRNSVTKDGQLIDSVLYAYLIKP
jgi:ribosomal-protein-alanine N-acetyltransferase